MAADRLSPVVADQLRVGYLVSEYPALSHAFIEREVRALRRLGVQVVTFSVRPAAAASLRSTLDRDAAASTTALRKSPMSSWLAAHRRLLVHAPRAYVSGLRGALRTGPRTLRARLWQLFYFVQAVLLLDAMRMHNVRHMHVHLANNAADIARIAVTIANARAARTHSWSLTVHGPTEFTDPVRFDLAAKVRSAAFVAPTSEDARDQLAALVGPEYRARLHLVHMGVDLDRYPGQSDARAHRPAGPLRVLFVGRLVEEKGPFVLLDAVADAAPRCHEGLVLHVVGTGPLQAKLAQEIARRGMQRYVTMLGPLGQDELPSQYAWADVFCLPSFAEGQPLVLMEAMSSELPVITTAVAGIPELVHDGVHGSVVPPGRPDRVADALVALTSADRRRRYGRAGRQTVERGFTSDAGARTLAAILTEQPAARAHG